MLVFHKPMKAVQICLLVRPAALLSSRLAAHVLMPLTINTALLKRKRKTRLPQQQLLKAGLML